MGREVRRVPKDWQHPKHKPLLDGYNKALADWREEKEHWDRGEVRDYMVYPDKAWRHDPGYTEQYESYDEYAGPVPVPWDYMPDWPEEERTHYQMYETCTEGTPISPIMETPEELARWLADNNASAFADMTATYEQWLSTIMRGFAPSAVVTPETGFTSGVAGLS